MKGWALLLLLTTHVGAIDTGLSAESLGLFDHGCSSKTCKNGGACIEFGGFDDNPLNFFCACTPEFLGTHCERALAAYQRPGTLAEGLTAWARLTGQRKDAVSQLSKLSAEVAEQFKMVAELTKLRGALITQQQNTVSGMQRALDDQRFVLDTLAQTLNLRRDIFTSSIKTTLGITLSFVLPPPLCVFVDMAIAYVANIGGDLETLPEVARNAADDTWLRYMTHNKVVSKVAAIAAGQGISVADKAITKALAEALEGGFGDVMQHIPVLATVKKTAAVGIKMYKLHELVEDGQAQLQGLDTNAANIKESWKITHRMTVEVSNTILVLNDNIISLLADLEATIAEAKANRLQ